MSIRNHRPTALLCAAAALAIGFVAACASPKGGKPYPENVTGWTSGPPTKTWDQAAVTNLAEQLAKAADAGWVSVLYMPNLGQVGSGDAADTDRLQYKTRRIREQAMGLEGALKAGKGRKETLPQVEDIGEQADDLRIILERMMVEQPIKEKAVAARKIWVQLLPYYGIKPPPAIPLE